MARGEMVLFLDSQARPAGGTYAEMIRSIDSSTGMTWFALEKGEDLLEIAENTAEGILRTLTQENTLPTGAIAIKRSFIARNDLPDGESENEILAKLLMTLVASHESVSKGSMHLAVSGDAFQISDAVRARALKHLIAVANIEDLFPQHNWNTHEKESAAASYHTLAALFIRLGDTESATECLRLSDQLEDSPRSLALKGLIAINRGEILGAVANMVSSLQQYEIRKKENAIHYSRFQPSDLKGINENLNAGLQALNKRDNERALNHFAEAVFSFDSFYNDYGVARLKS